MKNFKLHIKNLWIIAALLLFMPGWITPQTKGPGDLRKTINKFSDEANCFINCITCIQGTIEKDYASYLFNLSLFSSYNNFINPVCDSNIYPGNDATYIVKRAKRPVKINGNWDKSPWRSVKAIDINNFLGKIPPFHPAVQAKMMYDKDNVYIIFRVNDCYVRNVIEEYNGPVSGDACVEFFFSPDNGLPERYFNLEINAGGTPMMAYHIFQQKEYQKVSVEDLKKIEIAHSLPKKVDPEIVTPIVWTVEYKLPVSILEKYGSIVSPKPGVTWRANFYKTASKSSNPHWITWSVIDDLQANIKSGRFHQPRFFGQIKFEK